MDGIRVSLRAIRIGSDVSEASRQAHGYPTFGELHDFPLSQHSRLWANPNLDARRTRPRLTDLGGNQFE